MSDIPDWWQGATIYQIYPRSFLDANGDGVGDLPGITRRLDYVASLGVDAIWISPFFRSPMADFGYDISDYRDVDPLFGTLDDADHLIARAHDLGLRVIIDQVFSHTSDHHPWFVESRQDRSNARADWYVWADARDDGGPPNNWLSIFGGVAWKWEPRRGQYYLHNFLESQPDLNFHNPAVRQAALDNLAFWLDRGVDGVRLDAINFCFHDRQLRSNPPKPIELRSGRGVRADNPYAFQFHRFDSTQPENLLFLEDIRRLLDRYPGTVALGEVSSDDVHQTMAQYTAPGRLHLAYSFELLGDDGGTAHLRRTVERLQSSMGDAWPCWAISNHDVERVVDRWGRHMPGDPPRDMLGLLYTAVVCSLRGAVCIYQGEELALPEANVPFESLRDPYGIAFWPAFKGRDGCRTPMPWSGDANAGFTSGQPWLPIDPRHLANAVAVQDADSGSALNRFRQFMHWRARQPVLRHGNVRMLDAPPQVLALERFLGQERVLAVFNLGMTIQRYRPPVPSSVPIEGHGLASGRADADGSICLPPLGAYFARLEALCP